MFSGSRGWWVRLLMVLTALLAHSAQQTREASAWVPEMGRAGLPDVPRCDLEITCRYKQECGLLRTWAHVSVTVKCKSNLVLSIWSPNTRTLTALHSHIRETHGSSVYTWRGISHEHPLEARKTKSARASENYILAGLLVPGVHQRHQLANQTQESLLN